MRTTIRDFFVNHAIEPPVSIVAAVSGGADSTALLLALADLRDAVELIAAHVNHHLRDADSAADEEFVRDLCLRLGVPLHVCDGTLDDAAVRARGIEGAAREIRYARLGAVRQMTGARYVATGHQKDDQAETVLMRLVTGSGIAGLRGIHPVRADGFIRPLLGVSRAEIDAYLRRRGVTPRHDASNDDPRFLRNRIRTVVRDLGATESLAAIAGQAQSQWPIIERAIDVADEAYAAAGDDETRFRRWPDDVWMRQALLHRHIQRLDPAARDVSASDLARLARQVETIRRVSVTRELELVRKGEALVLRKRPQPVAEFELELAPEAPAFIPELGVTMYVAGRRGSPAGTRQLIQLPENAVPCFVVRNRRRGDRFHPLGLGGSKKLKDFLIDRKIAAEVRDRLPLLLWNDEIVWIGGVAVSDHFKVTSPGGALYEVWMEGAGAEDDDTADDGLRG